MDEAHLPRVELELGLREKTDGDGGRNQIKEDLLRY